MFFGDGWGGGKGREGVFILSSYMYMILFRFPQLPQKNPSKLAQLSYFYDTIHALSQDFIIHIHIHMRTYIVICHFLII